MSDFITLFLAVLLALLIAPYLQTRTDAVGAFIGGFKFVQQNGIILSIYLVGAVGVWMIGMIILPQLYMLDFSFRFNLPPRYQPLLREEGQATFMVSHELLPEARMQGVFKEVGMRPDPDTNSYPVTLTVDSPRDFTVAPGMPVQVQLWHPQLSAGNWRPPAEALFQRADGMAHVWRIDESSMRIDKVQVQLDATGALLGGLSPGDRIVAAGVDRLSQGQQVRVWVREGGL